MIDLMSFKDLASIELGAFKAKPTAFAAGQMEASATLWMSEDKLVQAGVWECTPGRFSADRSTSSEMCHIISGRAVLKTIEGAERVLKAGDFLVLPRGWRGEWDILEQVRKLYIMHHDAV